MHKELFFHWVESRSTWVIADWEQLREGPVWLERTPMKLTECKLEMTQKYTVN